MEDFNPNKRSNWNIFSFGNILVLISRRLAIGIRFHGRYARDEDIRWHSLWNTASGFRKCFPQDPAGFKEEPGGSAWKSLRFSQETARVYAGMTLVFLVMVMKSSLNFKVRLVPNDWDVRICEYVIRWKCDCGGSLWCSVNSNSMLTWIG